MSVSGGEKRDISHISFRSTNHIFISLLFNTFVHIRTRSGNMLESHMALSG